MKIITTNLKENCNIILDSFSDSRGIFTRLYCSKQLKNLLGKKKILQINYSKTKQKGSIRGMHYQLSPYKEAKFVMCIKGKVYDIAIDMRKNSKNFLKYQDTILSDKNNTINFIPEGFAHGFQTMTDNCELIYFHTNEYKKKYECSILYNEPLVDIKWPLKIKHISYKDKNIKKLNKKFVGI